MQSENPVIPPRLRKGACIGVFSPSGPVREQDAMDSGISLLREIGFNIRIHTCSDTTHGYLAGSDDARLASLHELLVDDEVDALMALRGGFGCLRLMDRVNFSLISSRPRIMIGFSDLTVLLNSVSERTGMVTVHGPVVTSLAQCSRQSIQALTTLLAGSQPDYNEHKQIEILRGGRTEGILRGGNLTTLTHLIATPWDISWKDSLLFLEDTNEPMYKIDRMLTQLHLAGRLSGLAGLILGSFAGETGPLENLRLHEQIWERVLELTAGYGYPVWAGFPIGHGGLNYPLPIGGRAVMDSGDARLRIETLFS